jgi:hypothetical protein
MARKRPFTLMFDPEVKDHLRAIEEPSESRSGIA